MNLLGVGTYGYVYRSRDGAVKKTYARGNLPSSFVRESDFLLRADHPNVVKCYKAEIMKREVLLKMELADRDFSTVDSVDNLPPRDVRNLFGDLFRGLEFIHRHGVVHCNIKPENLLLVDGTLKICDFGNPNYQSFEAVTRTFISTKSDIWAAGCSLFEKMRDQGYPRRKIFSEIVQKCLCDNPEERPSAVEVLSMLGIEPIEGEMETLVDLVVPFDPAWKKKREKAIIFFHEMTQRLEKHPHVWILSSVTLDRLIEEIGINKVLFKLNWVCVSILYLIIRQVHGENYLSSYLTGPEVDPAFVVYMARDIFGILGCKLYYPNRFTRLYDERGDEETLGSLMELT